MNIIVPIDRAFLCQHRNGDTFATNPTTDFVPYCQGSVIEKLKLVAQYTVQTVTEAGVGVEITAITDGSSIKLIHPLNTWDVGEGFVAGNTLYITANGNNTTGTVDIINGNEMIITSAAFFATLGTTDGDARDDYNVYSTTAPTSIRFAFGLIPNSQASPSFASLLNGETQLYTGQPLALSTPKTLTYAANPATDLGSVVTEYTGASGTGSSVFAFTIDHIFRFPHYIEDWLTNYLNSTAPLAFQGNDTYKYVNHINIGNNINNPNEGKIFEDAFLLGSIGFEGQNFNTGSTNYELTSSEITASAVVVTKPEITDTNVFDVTIKNNATSFANGEKCYLYVSKLPTLAEYTDQANTFEENFIFDQLDVLEGGGASSSTIITSYTAAKDGGDPTLMDLDFSISWSTTQQALFDENDNVFIGVIVENGPSVTAPTSDRTLIKIYAGPVTKNNDVTGLVTQNQINIYHASSTLATAIRTTNVDAWVNNSFILSGSLRVTKEANSINARIKAFKVRTIARIPSTDSFFMLDEYVFPFSSGFVGISEQNVGGTYYQQFNVDTERPIANAKSGSDLRAVKFSSVIPGSFQAYQDISWQLGIEIPHREWLFNQPVQDVAPEFYNVLLTEEFFNFNFRTSNYSGIESYQIFIIGTMELDYQLTDGSVITTTYHLSSDQSSIADFDVDVIGTGWSAVTTYEDTFGNPIDIPYAGLDCKVIVTITHPVSAALTPAGEIVFEYEGDSGQDSRLSSTKDLTSTTNALKGLTSAPTLVDLTQPSTTTTVLTCWIKGAALIDGVGIKTYGHLILNT